MLVEEKEITESNSVEENNIVDTDESSDFSEQENEETQGNEVEEELPVVEKKLNLFNSNDETPDDTDGQSENSDPEVENDGQVSENENEQEKLDVATLLKAKGLSFKSLDEAANGFKEAQKKITQLSQELSELKKGNNNSDSAKNETENPEVNDLLKSELSKVYDDETLDVVVNALSKVLNKTSKSDINDVLKEKLLIVDKLAEKDRLAEQQRIAKENYLKQQKLTNDVFKQFNLDKSTEVNVRKYINQNADVFGNVFKSEYSNEGDFVNALKNVINISKSAVLGSNFNDKVKAETEKKLNNINKGKTVIKPKTNFVPKAKPIQTKMNNGKLNFFIK